ncbi:MAG: asparaginase [Deltaproteobacteria bacterium]|nr:asparaginase [Deltaproteobacteria bacterium]
MKLQSIFIWLGLALVLATGPAQAGEPLPLVAVVTTGGTIAEKADPRTGGAVPAVSGEDLVASVPALAKVARLRVTTVCNMDSSQMCPEIWVKLSRAVDHELADPEVAGAVVTHGTDTMAEGAFFLDLTVKSPKPVVFVGAMRHAGDLSPDGPANLLNAVIQAASPQARGWGVTVTLNQYVNAAWDVDKTQTTNVQTFNSGERGYLGYITGGRVIRFRGRGQRLVLPLPEKLPKVVLLSTFAGDDGALVRYAVDRGAQGLVVEGGGAGNVNAQVFQAIAYALAKGVAVVITSRVQGGAVEPIYGDQGGGLTLQKAGCVLGGSLRGPKARLLLMLGLAQGADTATLTGYFDRP